MDITKCRIDMRAMTETGRIGYLLAIYNNGAVDIVFGDDRPMRMWASELDPVSDPCADCQQAADQTKDAEIARLKKCLKLAHEFLDKSATKINSVQDERDGWRAECETARRNAAYWREELTKLQNEALAEVPFQIRAIESNLYAPFAEVAKCYKQVEPEKLLMSQEARRVIEYLKATDCPVHIGDIMDGMEHVMSCMAIMDGLIEAREAGIVRLDDGKYSIARD